MQFRELGIKGAWEVTPRQFTDDRGVFLEWYKDEAFRPPVGESLRLRQANLSVSSAGVLRGIHFAEVPAGQAKYVTCVTGAAFDVVVDIRIGSPTFGQWDAVLIDDIDRRAVYISEGLGHAFLALEDRTVVTYLCSEPYAPGREHGINPLDPELAIQWPAKARDGSPLAPLLSDKDAAAPSLTEAAALGILPTMAAVERFHAERRP
jgi:dTDP-4-dehydrorhamnose 3,5-epimerase